VSKYVYIPNWRRHFEHYHSGRHAPWIKEPLSQLHDDNYLDLSCAQRGILHGLRLIYAETAQQGITRRHS
jgi:hypothetical protein